MGKSRAPQDFKELMLVKNPNIELIETYVNSTTRIKVKCHICSHEWHPKAYSLLGKPRCPNCYLKSKRKAHEVFVDELCHVNEAVSVLGTYATSDTEMYVGCDYCGFTWYTQPRVLLYGAGCPKCRINKSLRTHVQFVEELKLAQPHLEVTGTYETAKIKVEIRCTLDGFTWDAKPCDLLKNTGTSKCPICTKHGYKRDIGGVLYVYKFSKYYGFGITNNLKQRDRAHRRTFDKIGIDLDLALTFNGEGNVVYNLEKHLKQCLPIINTGITGFKTEAIPQAHRDLLFTHIYNYINAEERHGTQ